MSDLMISASNLGKRYKIKHHAESRRYKTLREDLAGKVFKWRNKKLYQIPLTEEFWALRNVDFEIKRGEVVGIIGRNGAGKSTLLKTLSRITEPTTGKIILRGTVASLLEVGTGFHPELTGRENIYLNGAILGMSRSEVRRKFDEIVDFAGVETFLDTPVKRYSSGMYVRLAFAVAAHIETEIMIIDEVLAVGDVEFQKKCLGKMESVARGNGRTILFVSHNMSAMQTLCNRAILLAKGQVVTQGTVSETIKAYLSRGDKTEGSWVRESSTKSTNVYLQKLDADLSGRQPNLGLSLRMRIANETKTTINVLVAVDICDALGAPFAQAMPSGVPFLKVEPGENQFVMKISLPQLLPSRYILDFWMGSHHSEPLDKVKGVLPFTVDEGPMSDRTYPYPSDHGVMMLPCTHSRYLSEPPDAHHLNTTQSLLG